MRSAAPLPPDWHEIVRANWKRTPGFVVAVSGDCLEVQAEETTGERAKVPGREFQAHPASSLKGFRPTGSWFMGILLCPGDDPANVMAFTGSLLPAEAERVLFYVHPAFDRTAMVAWHPSARPRIVGFSGKWQDFHRLFGRHHADRVYQDHSASA